METGRGGHSQKTRGRKGENIKVRRPMETPNPDEADRTDTNRSGTQNPSHNASIQFSEDDEICAKCKVVKGGAWVVECEECRQWFHFNCVEFDSDEVDEDEPWFCTRCIENQIVIEQSVDANHSARQNVQSSHMDTQNVEPTSAYRQEEATSRHQPEISTRARTEDAFGQNAFTQSLIQSFMDWRSTQPQVRDDREGTGSTQKQQNVHSIGLRNEMDSRHLTNVNIPVRSESSERSVSPRQTTTVAQVYRDPQETNRNSTETNRNSTFAANEQNIEKNISTLKVNYSTQIPTTSRASSVKSMHTVNSTNSFKSANSKRTNSSYDRARIEQQRIQAELQLQAKFDEERIALKMEALLLRENREKKFLTEKFRAMNDEDGIFDEDPNVTDVPMRPKPPTPPNDTKVVLAWIEDQRKRKSQNDLIPDISIEVSKNEIDNFVEKHAKGNTNITYRANQNSSQLERSTMINRQQCAINIPSGRVNSTLIKETQSLLQPIDQWDDSVQQNDDRMKAHRKEGKPSGVETHKDTHGTENQGIENQRGLIRQHNNVQHHRRHPVPVNLQVKPTVRQVNANPSVSELRQFSNVMNTQTPNDQVIVSHQEKQSKMDDQRYQLTTPPNQSYQPTGHDRHTQFSPSMQQSQSNNSTRPIAGQSSSFQYKVQRSQLTSEQIASRYVISKKLPYFNGNPREWPNFIQTYHNSTNACGFSNIENLDRLFNCLEDPARTLVESMLSVPDAVPTIMDILEDKYGRKEIVVKAVLQDIRSKPPIKGDKLEALSDYGYQVQNVCQTIKSQQMTFYLHDPELIQQLVDKLPYQSKIEWARHTTNMPDVSLATLSEWLIVLSRSINRISMPEIPPKEEKSDRKKVHKQENWKGGTYLNTHEDQDETKDQRKCEYCSKNCKNLAECFKFKKISIDERWKFLYNNKKVCRSCLLVHKNKCTILKECGVNGCSYKHHPILHDNEKMIKSKQANSTQNKSSAKQNANTQKANSHTNSSCNAHRGSHAVLYKIIPVTLSYRDKTISTYAYMDEGSGLTLMENELAEQLGLKGIVQKLSLRWTSGTVRHENDSMRVTLKISGVGENQHHYQMRDVRTVKSLDLPMQKIDKNEIVKRHPYLEPIPFENFEAAPRILIGLDNVKLGLSREYVEGGWTEPVASNTLLGWVVHGQNGKSCNEESQHMQHHVLSINQCECQSERDDETHRLFEEFFSLDNFGVRALENPVESKEIQRAKQIMETTTVRKDIRFETGLLWKYDDVKLPNNFAMALKRLECQERRMKSNPALTANINEQIRNFLAKGYARKLSPEEANTYNERTWYLPIFHHLDPKKPEKVRLVWDAAAKYKGISLNSMLMTGPDNLASLIDILRRFREKCIPIGADLEEMFHQVEVIPQDRCSLRFMWRNGKTEATPVVYEMKVLPFGTNCSPTLAQNAKNKNASEFEEEYPEAAQAIKKNHYVDDWLDSQHTVEDTIRLAKQVKEIHRQGGFNLRKFISNSKEVLDALGEYNVQSTKDLNVNTTLDTQKVLGMWWDARTDCFTYSLKFTKLNEEVLLGLRAPTKRELLKTLMSIYDPLGLIAFFLVYLKIILQEVWKAETAWDEQIPENLNEKWKKWVKLLPKVEKVQIPRLYSTKISPGTAQLMELHTLVDASDHAQCAVCFLRIIDENGIDCVNVGAKTKVTPLKPLLSTAKLELLAAVLGTRLAKSIGDGLSIKINKRYFWSDSRDVVCWLRSTKRKYRQFVAFRVGEILEATTENEWRWVPGKLNVADDGTKWERTPNFDLNSRWFRGPQFLYENESSWPTDLPSDSTTEEEIHVHLIHTKMNPPSEIVPENFSNWARLINAQALSTRYIEKLIAKVKGQSLVGPLKTDELKRAESTLYKLAQFDCFQDELATLREAKNEYGAKSYVKKSSPIYKISPYLGEDGLLRVRGRIDNIRGVKFETKRPIILPKKHKITELVVNNYHRMYLHGNSDTVINELNQRFFIPNMRAVLKNITSNCQVCKNNKAKPIMPEMGDLPIGRLSPGVRAFTYTGVDYFGPVNVIVNRRTEKRWGVLFTCLTTRAIHIELAPSLSADSCILCIRNFTNLRGTPVAFHSDNGTNFKAADKELQKEFEKLDKEKIQSTYTRTYTSWHFNPPAAPHFGGSWERLIGMVKENLKMVMFTRTPKEELLRSYLLEVVNIVNSRPLTHLPIDTIEDEALTPNHFIFGSSNGHMAPGDFPFEEQSLTKNWRRSQELTNKFWRRWIKEYLPKLMCRSKWYTKAKPIEIGDVVLLVDEQNARNSYPKGIVLDVLPDKHGQVRQATIKIAEVITNIHGKTENSAVRFSIKTRPVAKLAVLDVSTKADGIKPAVLETDEVNNVKPIGASDTKCLNGEENVIDNSSVGVTDDTDTNVTDQTPVKSDVRKPSFIRRSKRIAQRKVKL